MDKRIEEYLKSVALPEYESPRHQQELRRRLLDEMKKKRTIRRRKPLRIVFVLAALVCLSAIAIGGAKYRKWYFKGKKDGAYVFTKEPEEIQKNGKKVNIYRAFSISSSDPDFSMSPSEIEQREMDLEEMDLLRQQSKRELVRVIEFWVEGEVGRTYTYKYVFADGREATVGEGDPDEEFSRKVFPELIKEVYELRKAGKGEHLAPEERSVKGKPFVFERYRFTLKDGCEVIHSVGVPKEESANR